MKIFKLLTILALGLCMSIGLQAQRTGNASNPNNPFDHYGKDHNRQVQSFYNAMYGGKEINAEAGSRAFKATAYGEVHKTLNLGQLQGNMRGYSLQNHLKELGFSDALIRELVAVEAIIDKGGNPVPAIKALEQKIPNNPKFNDDDKEVLFIACSIARHSHVYWTNNYPKWKPAPAPNTPPPPAPPQGGVVEDIVKNDFVAGAATAGALKLGLIVPGVNVGVAKTIAGTAAVTSAATAVYHATAAVVSGAASVVKSAWKKLGSLTGWW